MKRHPMILLCSMILLGCASTSTVTTTASADEAAPHIHAANSRFVSAFNSADWDTVASFYADDAVIMAPNAEIVRGSAGARQVFASFGPNPPRLITHSDRVVQSCDLAFEYGRYENVVTSPAGASTVTDRGKYITVWRRTPGGEWKIIGDTFNTSLPAK